ncbi:MAG: hypothetical protein FJY85_17500 [Deltaproteobacteria bacterium]|nr:hypothetical protein [Deltaproteobacteria bacterium]
MSDRVLVPPDLRLARGARLDRLVYVSGETWSRGERLARHGFSRRGGGW